MIHLVTETVGFDVKKDPTGQVQLIVAIDPEGREDVFSIPLSPESAKGISEALMKASIDITIPTDEQVQQMSKIITPEEA